MATASPDSGSPIRPLDVVLSSGWLVRFGGSVGDREALAIGVKIDT